MKLSMEEGKRFFTIWWLLLHHVNQEKNLLGRRLEEMEASVLPDLERMQLRRELWKDNTLLQSFVAKNPCRLSFEDLSIVRSWARRLEGEFFIFRHLQKHTVFLGGGEPVCAFGVHGLSRDLSEMYPCLPVLVKGVLLPFEGRIVYDTFFEAYPISFGGGIKQSLNDEYREAKKREGITESL